MDETTGEIGPTRSLYLTTLCQMRTAVIVESAGAWVTVLSCILLLAITTGLKLLLKSRLLHVLWCVSGTFGYRLESRRHISSMKLTAVIRQLAHCQ
jgi:hypothetical protein